MSSATAFQKCFSDYDSHQYSCGRRELIRGYCIYALKRREIISADVHDAVAIDERYLKFFEQLYALHVTAMRQRPQDLIGSIMMGADKRGKKGYSGNEYMGQFFTGDDVARLMARLSLIQLFSIGHSSDDRIRILEPSAGCGAIVLAYADVADEFDGLLSRLDVTAVELSQDAFYALALQMDLAGISGRVVRGDSVSGEIYDEIILGDNGSKGSAVNDTAYDATDDDYELGGLFAM